MPHIPTTRVERQVKYAPNISKITRKPSYLSALNTGSQNDWDALKFDYIISENFTRNHSNPPLWVHAHAHDFRVEIFLQSTCCKDDLYGLDMVDCSRMLREYIELIPTSINDHPMCPNGTTEQMCYLFSKFLVDSHVTITQVRVSETPDRFTCLRLP